MSYSMNIGPIDFDYTYNVAPMWYDRYTKGIRTHYGMTGEEAIPVLWGLYNHMVENKERLEIMNPTNGWGDYEGALRFVAALLDASILNPKEVWKGD